MSSNSRLLTQSNSKIAKLGEVRKDGTKRPDIVEFLSDEEAWSSLTEEQQRKLYALLRPTNDQQQLDHTVHPFNAGFKPYIKHFLYEWVNDLKDGRHTLKWRTEAKEASGDRAAGMFDDVLATEREEKWGRKEQTEAEE